MDSEILIYCFEELHYLATYFDRKITNLKFYLIRNVFLHYSCFFTTTSSNVSMCLTGELEMGNT